MSTPCPHFNASDCRSCHLLAQPYVQQCEHKQVLCQQLLSHHVLAEQWLTFVPSAPFSFRNKAKMVVSGHWRDPVLGIVNHQGLAVSLTDCLLYPAALRAAFEPIRGWISRIELMPYSVQHRTGELKFVLVTLSELTNEVMVRFVLRSKKMLPLMQSALPYLQAELPNLRVASVNIQSVAMAIMEGDEEVVLTDHSDLTIWLNELPLLLQPKSFFQTNDAVAAALYRQVQAWIKEIQPDSLWDLFCGVGGFALHSAQVMQGKVTGIEVSPAAIESASASARRLGMSNVHFRALSASDFALGQTQLPQTVIVNPPRRGIGDVLCNFLNCAESVEWLVYSSCNPETLAKDLTRMPAFQVVKAQVFDMFPHTHHAEVLVLLKHTQ